jgi:putative ABC transport system permease protein
VRKALRTYARLIGFAATTLTAYKLRSLFVALAVALGVASLTVIVTSVDGAQRKAREIVEMFGPDAAFILGGDIRSRAVGKRRLTLS